MCQTIVGKEYILLDLDSRAILRMYYCIWQMNVAVYQNLHVKNITKDILTL